MLWLVEFPKILARYLREQCLTQTAFAAGIGVRPSQVSEWLGGKAKPGYDTLREICRKSRVDAAFWLGLTDEY